MSVRLAAVTIDCENALVAAEFWSATLARPIDPGASVEFASIGMPGHRDPTGWSISDADGPTWLFTRVPEPKAAKNRMHVDLAAPDVEAEVTRLVELGATRVEDMDEWGYQWTVLRDPEGNEFCVAQLR
jgi:hypothetical protein